MATDKQEFVDVAAEIFAEFADFATPRTFTLATGFDPITEQPGATISDTVPAIRQDYDIKDVDGQNIQQGDFVLLAEAVKFSTIEPRTDGVKVDVDGVACKIVKAMKDAADAVWVMQVRKL